MPRRIWMPAHSFICSQSMFGIHDDKTRKKKELREQVRDSGISCTRDSYTSVTAEYVDIADGFLKNAIRCQNAKTRTYSIDKTNQIACSWNSCVLKLFRCSCALTLDNLFFSFAFVSLFTFFPQCCQFQCKFKLHHHTHTAEQIHCV